MARENHVVRLSPRRNTMALIRTQCQAASKALGRDVSAAEVVDAAVRAVSVEQIVAAIPDEPVKRGRPARVP